MRGDRSRLLQRDKAPKSSGLKLEESFDREETDSGAAAAASFSPVELVPVWTDCPEFGSAPSILNGLLGKAGEEALLSGGFFFPHDSNTQEMRGGAQRRCGLQAGERQSVCSPTPTGSAGAALPAVHLPEGLSNPSPFKVRSFDHLCTTAGNTCPNRKTPSFAPVYNFENECSHAK